MAKNKRNKVVPLTKTTKKEHDKKSQLVEKVHKYIDQYEYCYAFNYKNMTNFPMQELRKYYEESKFLVGKNKVLQVALGRTEEDSYRLNSYHLSNYLKGNCGLFFTNYEPDHIIK
jgi:mRNA turnover protein 4